MKGYLLDTSVVSGFAPSRRDLTPRAQAWFRGRDDALFISAVTIAETFKCISKLRRAGSGWRADAFEQWIDDIEATFGRRVLALDSRIARVLGTMSDTAQASGLNPGFPDVAIAATAKAHGHTVLTRNLKHFVPLGIDALDPFETIS